MKTDFNSLLYELEQDNPKTKKTESRQEQSTVAKTVLNQSRTESVAYEFYDKGFIRQYQDFSNDIIKIRQKQLLEYRNNLYNQNNSKYQAVVKTITKPSSILITGLITAAVLCHDKIYDFIRNNEGDLYNFQNKLNEIQTRVSDFYYKNPIIIQLRNIFSDVNVNMMKTLGIINNLTIDVIKTISEVFFTEVLKRMFDVTKESYRDLGSAFDKAGYKMTGRNIYNIAMSIADVGTYAVLAEAGPVGWLVMGGIAVENFAFSQMFENEEGEQALQRATNNYDSFIEKWTASERLNTQGRLNQVKKIRQVSSSLMGLSNKEFERIVKLDKQIQKFIDEKGSDAYTQLWMNSMFIISVESKTKSNAKPLQYNINNETGSSVVVYSETIENHTVKITVPNGVKVTPELQKIASDFLKRQSKKGLQQMLKNISSGAELAKNNEEIVRAIQEQRNLVSNDTVLGAMLSEQLKQGGISRLSTTQLDANRTFGITHKEDAMQLADGLFTIMNDPSMKDFDFNLSRFGIEATLRGSDIQSIINEANAQLNRSDLSAGDAIMSFLKNIATMGDSEDWKDQSIKGETIGKLGQLSTLISDINNGNITPNQLMALSATFISAQSTYFRVKQKLGKTQLIRKRLIVRGYEDLFREQYEKLMSGNFDASAELDNLIKTVFDINGSDKNNIFFLADNRLQGYFNWRMGEITSIFLSSNFLKFFSYSVKERKNFLSNYGKKESDKIKLEKSVPSPESFVLGPFNFSFISVAQANVNDLHDEEMKLRQNISEKLKKCEIRINEVLENRVFVLRDDVQVNDNTAAEMNMSLKNEKVEVRPINNM